MVFKIVLMPRTINAGSIFPGTCKEDWANINLEMAREFKSILEDRGYKVVLTRESTNSLASKKKDDMQKRKEIILKSKPDMVVSLHVNKYQDSKRRGVQVFYDDTKKNKNVGEQLQYLINSKVNKKYAGRDDLKSLAGDYFICKCTPYPYHWLWFRTSCRYGWALDY